MKDGIIKGTGNSRYLKGAGWPSTYAEFKSMAEAGTLPIDLNGINEAGWQQIGDALNKGNLLSDATAAKLNNVSTPDAAFDLLSRFNGGLGNEYVWEKKEPYNNYDEAYQAPLMLLVGQAGYYFWYSDSFEIVENKFSLINPVAVLLSSTNTNNTEIIKGKYVQTAGNTLPSTYFTTGSVYYIPENATFSISGSQLVASFGYVCSNPRISYNHISFINSPDADAYPPLVSDGYTYTALGQIGEKTRIATGSYVGTGTYGNDHDILISCPFPCRFVFMTYGSAPSRFLGIIDVAAFKSREKYKGFAESSSYYPSLAAFLSSSPSYYALGRAIDDSNTLDSISIYLSTKNQATTYNESRKTYNLVFVG